MSDSPSSPLGSRPDPAAADSGLVHQICLEFEQSCQSGTFPPISPLLEHVPELTRNELLESLLRLEIAYRRRRGESTLASTYRERFPAAATIVDAVFDSFEDCAEGDVSAESDKADDKSTQDYRARVDDGDTEDFSQSGRNAASEKQQRRSARETLSESLPIANHFRFQHKLGQGGMGAVYAAHDTRLGRSVAIKVIRQERLGDQRVIAQFLSEAQLASRLQHPGICPVYELGLIHAPGDESRGASPFISMKHVEGKTFALAMRDAEREGIESRTRWLEVLAEVSEAVAYAHDCGVIHRDLKPENIMLGAHGETQVMDWGLAKFSGAELAAAERAEASQGQTSYGVIKGTWPYMSPEQASGRTDEIDARTDVFALGSILCLILTGEPAYTGTGSTLMRAAQSGDLDDAEQRLTASSADESLIALALACLAPRREDRLTNANEVASALASHRVEVERRLHDAEIETERERGQRIAAGERLKTTRWRMGLALAILIFLAIAIGAGGYAVQSSLTGVAAQRAYADQLQGRSPELLKVALGEPWNDVAWDRFVENRRFEAEALAEAARRAEWLIRLPGGERLVADIPSREVQTQSAHQQAMKDRDLCLALREARLGGREVESNVFDYSKKLTGYRDALKVYGLDFSTMPVDELADAIQNSAVRDEIIGAMDDWLQYARFLKTKPAWQDVFIETLAIADADAARTQLRKALVKRSHDNNEDGSHPLETLADQWNVSAHPAHTTQALCAALARQDRKKAIRILEALIENNPRLLGAHADLGFAHQRLDPPDLTAALSHWRAVVVLAPESPGAHYNLGHLLAELERFEAAAQSYRSAIRHKPDYFEPYHNLGEILRNQGRSAEAETYLEKARQLQPEDASTHRLLGVIRHEMGRTQEAETFFQKAIQLQPDLAPAHQDYGNLCGTLKRYREAEEHFQRAIELKPDNPTVYNDYAVLLAARKQWEAAEKNYRKAIELQDDFAEAHRNLGDLYGSQGKTQDAESRYRIALRHAPELASAHANLANLLLSRKEYQAAETHLRAALKSRTDLAEIYNSLGGALYYQDKHGEAEALLIDAIERFPNYRNLYNTLAAVLFAKKEFERAEPYLRKAVEANSQDFKALANLGKTLLELGRYQAAVETLDKAFELAGRPSDGQLVRWRAAAHEQLRLQLQLAAVLSGKRELTRAEERVAMASFCQSPTQRHYWQSARLYREAFDQDGVLAEVTPQQRHRYNAACAAALAAALAGKDAAQLSSDDQVRWRDQAFAWLRADLGFWRDLAAELPAAHPTIRKTMAIWLADADLASVREPSLVKLLPGGEQRQWESLWDDVQHLYDAVMPGDDNAARSN